MTGLTWLHLSDWHQGSKDFDREVVRDKLLEDLEKRKTISPDLAKIDFIIFSGDVANSAKPEEYQAAKEELFEHILKATGLGPDMLFIVPGNHDLNRDDLDDLPPALSKPLSSNAEVQNWIDNERKRKILLGPFHAFSDFVTTYTGQDKPDYANVRKIPIGNKSIALLGLNSAWMCGRNRDSEGKVDDERHVLVGEPQIHRCLKKISKADVRIAILHHPFEWLAKFDRDKIESRLMSETDFILRGHQHQPQVSVIKSTLGDCVIIPAGASYYRRNIDDLRYSNAYNLVHLDFDSGRCVVFLRCWSNSLNRWREDIDSQPPNGRFDFNFSKFISARIDPANCSQEDAKDIPIKTPPNEASSSQIPHQIPPPPADFTGRDDDLKDLLDHFNQGATNQGATITGLRGMGGIGKTALAFKLAEKLIDRYPDGQIMVNMNGTSDEPLTAAGAMAQVIHAYDTDARLPLNESELSGLYRSKLHNKRVLILLDNAANDNQVRPLVPPSSCGLIVTSREKFTLPGLKEKDLNVMQPSDACALLLKIAGRIGGHAEELARLCGHLPLALRAASSLLANEHDLTLAEYLKELRIERTRLERIGGEGVDLDVEASFNLSYRRLKPDEAKAFRLLSIFPADFDANSEEYLCKDRGHKNLSKFVRWSLVDFYEHNSRYRLHDLARIFAAKSLLKEDGEAVRTMALQRYFIRYLNVLSKAHDLYKKGGNNIILGLEILDRELANIQAGQAWVERNAESNTNAAALCISYANSAGILSLRLHPYNLIRWLKVSLNAARRLNKPAQVILGNMGNSYYDMGDARKAIEYHNHALDISREISDIRGEGAVLANLGNAYYDLGKVRMAIEYYDQGLTISREVRNKRSEGIALGNLGLAYVALSEVRKAIEYYDLALAISREVGDKRSEGTHLGNMGNAYCDLGKMRKAIEYYDQALAINREIGDKRGEGIVLSNLGLANHNQGIVRKAIEYYDQALAISREIGNKRSEGIVLGNLGLADHDLGMVRKAIEYCDQALVISREIGDKRNEGNNLGNMGNFYCDLGKMRKAIEYYDEALAINREIGDKQGEGSTLDNLGLAYADLGEVHKAIEYYDQALAINHEIENPWIEGDNLCNFGKAYAALGDTNKAIGYYEQSLVIVRKTEYRKKESEVLCNLGKAYADLDETRRAIGYYKQSLEITRKIEYRRGEGDALFNMSLALEKLGQRPVAIDHAKAALQIFEQIESPDAEKARQKLSEWQG